MEERDDGKEGMPPDSDTVCLSSLGHLALLCASVPAAVNGGKC